MTEQKKLEVNLGICKICELVMAYVKGRGCSGCGSETEPLKAAIKSDGTILFYTEELQKEEKRHILEDTTDM